jgi:hypothetical protein
MERSHLTIEPSLIQVRSDTALTGATYKVDGAAVEPSSRPLAREASLAR